MARVERLSWVKREYDRYKNIIPPEVIARADSLIANYYETPEVYENIILQLEYYYYFVMPIEKRDSLELSQSMKNINIVSTR